MRSPFVGIAAVFALALLAIAPGCRRDARTAGDPARPPTAPPPVAEAVPHPVPTSDDEGVVGERPRIRISGEAFLRERIALPRDAVLVVRLVEVEAGSNAENEVATVRASSRRLQPIPFEILVDEDDLEERASYALTAVISRRGTDSFATDAPLRVLVPGTQTTGLRLLLRRLD